ncbi:MAG: hypothetical protein GY941_19815 [Planctomycetes bacterium]|nr:hypothetical protein [Planctomycetota bacterium]
MDAEFPALNDYEQHIIDITQAIGLSHGGEVTPYTEIKAWCELSGLRLNIWEVETVKLLSNTYITATHELKDDTAQPPFMTKEGQAKKNAAYAKARLAAIRRGMK